MMNIFRRHAVILNVTQRFLDVAILIAISILLNGIIGPHELFRMLAIYGSLLMIAIFSFLNIYQSWRIQPITSQMKSIFLAWILVLVSFEIASSWSPKNNYS